MHEIMFRSFRGELFEHGYLVLERMNRFYLIETENHEQVFVADDIEALVADIEVRVDAKKDELVAVLNDFWGCLFDEQLNRKGFRGGIFGSDYSTSKESE